MTYVMFVVLFDQPVEVDIERFDPGVVPSGQQARLDMFEPSGTCSNGLS